MDDDISVTHIHPYGTLELAAMRNGMRVSRRYYGYSRADAVADFKTQLNTRHDA